MDALGELRADLAMIAERSVAIMDACSNEEGTKLYLVLPVLGALGYDYSNPYEVQPEYAADFRDGMPERVDYVIMRDGTPVIAVECKKAGTELAANRGQLRAYFTALQSVRLGILTDGIRFEFFVDCEAQNIMDAEPFAILDLEAATRGAIPRDVLEVLSSISAANFDPDTIAEIAETRLVAKRLRAVLMQEVREPSDELCRMLLQRTGMRNIRRASIQARYGALIRTAFEESLVLPVLEALRASPQLNRLEAADSEGTGQRIVTTDREIAVYRYVCRRLAFLANDEHEFSAIERVHYRDYLGKFALYYENVRKGRLFDFVEGSNGYDKFSFPEPFGEIITNAIADIDEPLRVIFTERVREVGAPRSTNERLALRR